MEGRRRIAGRGHASHPPIDLFRQRLPKIAYAMDQLGPMLLLPKAQAILHRYIQTQPKGVIGALPFDVDIECAAWAWDETNLPAPNLIIINPDNARAHYLYLIGEPIFLGISKPETRAAQYLRTVHRAMIHQLGSDPGYSGFTVKNPLHNHWRVWSPRKATYDLDELYDWLKPKALEFARARTQPTEEIGLGRNVALFNLVRRWAYRWVLTYKETSNAKQWLAVVEAHAAERNAEFKYPLEKPEVGHTAKSIANWTWKKFSKAGFSEIQSERGKKSGKARSQNAETRLIRIIKEKREIGEIPSIAEIAKATGVDRTTIWRQAKALNPKSPIYPDMVNATSETRSADFVCRAIELRTAGMTLREIAAELGVSKDTVSRVLKKAGL